MTTGENKLEGALYGVLVWAVMSGVLMYLATQGFKAGFSGMVAMANTGNTTATANGMTWQDMARRSGVPQAEIDRMSATTNDPNRVEDTATRAAWYSFLGTLIGMAAAAIGGFVGAGPTLRLFTI